MSISLFIKCDVIILITGAPSNLILTILGDPKSVLIGRVSLQRSRLAGTHFFKYLFKATDLNYTLSDKKKLKRKNITQLNTFGVTVPSHQPYEEGREAETTGSSLRSLRPVITTTESKSEELQEKHTYDTLHIPNYENNDIDDINTSLVIDNMLYLEHEYECT